MVPQTGEKALCYIGGENNKDVTIGFEMIDKLSKAVSGHGFREFYELFGETLIDLGRKLLCLIQTEQNISLEK